MFNFYRTSLVSGIFGIDFGIKTEAKSHLKKPENILSQRNMRRL